MTQHRPLAARQDGRHPNRLPGHVQMADGVHGAVDANQPLRREPMVDRVGPEPKVQQLLAGDPATLAPGNRRNQCVQTMRLTFAA